MIEPTLNAMGFFLSQKVSFSPITNNSGTRHVIHFSTAQRRTASIHRKHEANGKFPIDNILIIEAVMHQMVMKQYFKIIR